MKGSGNKAQGEKKTSGVRTFSVPSSFIKSKDTISIKTNVKSELSKEEIINNAFKLHSQGNILDASKYYQKYLDQGFEDHRVYSNLGTILKDSGNLKQAEIYTRKAIEIMPDFVDAHSNLGTILTKLGNLKEAELSTRKAIKIKPDIAQLHSNLGRILMDIGNLEEAALSFRKAIKLKDNFADAHCNLGSILKDLGHLKEAELSTLKAIKINPSFALAYSNLGNILSDQGKTKEAENSYRKAIEIDPDLAMAHQNLGSVLLYMRKFKDAEISLRKAIELKLEDSIVYRNLGICLYLRGEKSSALKYILKGSAPDTYDDIINKLLIKFIEEEKKSSSEKLKIKSNQNNFIKEFSVNNPLILNRKVEPEIIDSLYKIKSIDQAIHMKPHYGNLRGSDYFLLEINDPAIRKLKKDLISIASESVSSDIFITESFSTISKSGAGLVSHNHLNNIDLLFGPDLSDRKFSLVYYLSIGDQDCEEPGILKLEDPNIEILPTNGLIILFPAKRKHSVFYKGTKDRIIIGVNFYRI
tara:strand:+ start:330 stop:1910 length:1581 start_codon:yes stop_codon:yes gene_type:complete